MLFLLWRIGCVARRHHCECRASIFGAARSAAQHVIARIETATPNEIATAILTTSIRSLLLPINIGTGQRRSARAKLRP